MIKRPSLVTPGSYGQATLPHLTSSTRVASAHKTRLAGAGLALIGTSANRFGVPHAEIGAVVFDPHRRKPQFVLVAEHRRRPAADRKVLDPTFYGWAGASAA